MAEDANISSDYRFKAYLMSERTATIGRVAQQTGCKIETIRYYEKEKLLKPDRTAGGHRLYDDNQVERVFIVKRSRELGFSLSEIRQLLDIADANAGSCRKVIDIAENHLRDVRGKIADLKKIERTLRRLATQCSGHDVRDCTILDALKR
jgi:MerR family mercuric resistance operon transcriptional regulator